MKKILATVLMILASSKAFAQLPTASVSITNKDERFWGYLTEPQDQLKDPLCISEKVLNNRKLKALVALGYKLDALDFSYDLKNNVLVYIHFYAILNEKISCTLKNENTKN